MCEGALRARAHAHAHEQFLRPLRTRPVFFFFKFLAQHLLSALKDALKDALEDGTADADPAWPHLRLEARDIDMVLSRTSAGRRAHHKILDSGLVLHTLRKGGPYRWPASTARW